MSELGFYTYNQGALLLIIVAMGFSLLFLKLAETPNFKKIWLGSLFFELLLAFYPSTLGSLFLFSVICTAGIGFLFWMLIFWLVGNVVATVFRIEFKNSKQHTPSKAKKAIPAITEYILKARSSGLNDQQIHENLIRAGWVKANIDVAFKEV